MDLKKCEMPCSALRIHTANIGSPIGLTRNAMVKRMIPFFGEYVTRTITPRSATMLLTIRNRIAQLLNVVANHPVADVHIRAVVKHIQGRVQR